MWNTSVKIPIGDETEQDSSGFVTHKKKYLEHIPASKRNTTRSDETLANQLGYTVSAVFEIDKACYNGKAGYLIDEQDDVVYDIKRKYSAEKSNLISLTCEVRENGKI